MDREAAEKSAKYMVQSSLIDGSFVKVDIDPGFSEGRQFKNPSTKFNNNRNRNMTLDNSSKQDK